MNLKLFIEKNLTFGKCPNCGKEGSLERVRIDNDFERLYLLIFRKKKYHCKECKWYGYRFIYAVSKNYIKILLIYLLILLIIAVIGFYLNSYMKKRLTPHLTTLELFTL